MSSAAPAIQAALYAHLKAVSLPTALRIAPEGKDFDAKGKAYLRPTFLPGEPSAFDTDETDTLVGLYQIDVFWPEDQGIADPMQVAAALCTHYRRGTRLQAGAHEVHILQPPGASGALQEPGLLQIPVRIRWTAFVSADA